MHASIFTYVHETDYMHRTLNITWFCEKLLLDNLGALITSRGYECSYAISDEHNMTFDSINI